MLLKILPFELTWYMYALLGAWYLWACWRVTGRLTKLGYSFVAWFPITMLTAGVPTTVMLFIARKRIADARRRQLVPPGQQDQSSGAEPSETASSSETTSRDAARPDRPFRCPHCGSILTEAELSAAQVATAVPLCPRCKLPLRQDDIA